MFPRIAPDQHQAGLEVVGAAGGQQQRRDGHRLEPAGTGTGFNVHEQVCPLASNRFDSARYDTGPPDPARPLAFPRGAGLAYDFFYVKDV